MNDKVMHMIAGLLIFGTLSYFYNMDVGAWAVLAAAAGKEYGDGDNDKLPSMGSVLDFIATVALPMGFWLFV